MKLPKLHYSYRSILLIIALLSLFLNCHFKHRTYILKRTSKLAVLKSAGETEFDAKNNAKKTAKKIFSAYKIKSNDCQQEYSYSYSYSYFYASEKSKRLGSSFSRCIIMIQKK